MAMRDLIPWNRGRDMTVRRGEDFDPFLTLHREMPRFRRRFSRL
jgi:HSP20 family protein